MQSFNSPEEAVKAGCTTSCGICKPPKAVEKKESKNNKENKGDKDKKGNEVSK